MTEAEEPVPETDNDSPKRSPRLGLDKRKSAWVSVPLLNESEIEAATENYASTDAPRSKTLSRRIVEDYLQHVSRKRRIIVLFRAVKRRHCRALLPI